MITIIACILFTVGNSLWKDSRRNAWAVSENVRIRYEHFLLNNPPYLVGLKNYDNLWKLLLITQYIQKELAS